MQARSGLLVVVIVILLAAVGWLAWQLNQQRQELSRAQAEIEKLKEQLAAATAAVTKPVETPSPTPAEPAEAGKAEGKLCIVYDVGGRGDLSFNDMAALGGDRARRELGLELLEVQSATEADYAPNLRRLARSGDCLLIVSVGFLLTDATAQAADEFPDQLFAIIDGFVPDKPNVLSILFKEHEGSALAGALAAAVAKRVGADAVGIVLGIEIPVLWRFEIGYKWGVRWVDNEFDPAFGQRETIAKRTKILWVYTGSFNDPARGKTAAETQLAQGAMVIYNVAGATGLGIFEAVEAIGKSAGRETGPPFAIGVDADQDHIKPGFILASMMKRVDRGVFEAARLAQQGLLRERIQELGGVLTLGLADGGVGLSRLEDLDTFLQLAIEAGQLSPDRRSEIFAKILKVRLNFAEAFGVAEALAGLIRSGEVEIPDASAQEALTEWRAKLD